MLLNYEEIKNQLDSNGSSLVGYESAELDMRIIDNYYRGLPEQSRTEEVKKYIDSNPEFNLLEVLKIYLINYTKGRCINVEYVINNDKFILITYDDTQTSDK